MNEWKKRSDYSIQKGEWVIGKTIHPDGNRYTLWKGTKRMKTYMTVDEAKEAAK